MLDFWNSTGGKQTELLRCKRAILQEKEDDSESRVLGTEDGAVVTEDRSSSNRALFPGISLMHCDITWDWRLSSAFHFLSFGTGMSINCYTMAVSSLYFAF